jgi:hypothetical protein
MRCNGNYRLYTTHPEGLYATGPEKRIFFPLSEEQGKKLIAMRAQDIKKNHETASLQVSNVQHYIDEILGSKFYNGLLNLIEMNIGHHAKEHFSLKLSTAKNSLDPYDFEAVIEPLVKKLIEVRKLDHIHQLIEISLKTLNTLLQVQGDLPTLEQLKPDFASHEKEMHESFKVLLHLCFDALHPYRADIFEIEQNALIKHILRVIESISWKWLHDHLKKILTFALAKRRGYAYQVFDPVSKKTVTKTARYVNFSSKLIHTYNPETLQKKVWVFAPQK